MVLPIIINLADEKRWTKKSLESLPEKMHLAIIELLIDPCFEQQINEYGDKVTRRQTKYVAVSKNVNLNELYLYQKVKFEKIDLTLNKLYCVPKNLAAKNEEEECKPIEYYIYNIYKPKEILGWNGAIMTVIIPDFLNTVNKCFETISQQRNMAFALGRESSPLTDFTMAVVAIYSGPHHTIDWFYDYLEYYGHRETQRPLNDIKRNDKNL